MLSTQSPGREPVRSGARGASRDRLPRASARSHRLHAHPRTRRYPGGAGATPPGLGEERHDCRPVPPAAHAGSHADAPERLADAGGDEPQQGCRQVHRRPQSRHELRDGGGLHGAARRRRPPRSRCTPYAGTRARAWPRGLSARRRGARGPAYPPERRQSRRASRRCTGGEHLRADALADDGRHDPGDAWPVSRIA